MSCPTCSADTIGIGSAEWCHVCGTVVNDFDGMKIVPKLVERCRAFRALHHPSFKAEVGIFGDPVLASEWERIGIAEAINLPADRRPG